MTKLWKADMDDSNQKYRGKRAAFRNLMPLWLSQSRPSSSPKQQARRPRVLWVPAGFVLTLVVVVSVQRLLSLYMGSRRFVPAPIANIHRECPKLSYTSIAEDRMNNNAPLPTICLTTLTDHASKSTLQRFVRWRNFDSILNVTMSNKQAYVDTRSNYKLFDGSHLLDNSRPPAWTKVKTVQALLSQQHHCDWIVWMDADTVIMNPNIAWEDFLPSSSSQHSLVIGSDKGGGYNSGVFAFRNTPWTRDFLEHWWNMTDFVRPPGLALSGDNASLKHYLAELQKSGEFDAHVVVPPRCHLNSFAVLVSPSQYEYAKEHLEDYRDKWYMSSDYYHKGDFIAHFPGIDNKEEALKLFLDLATKPTLVSA